MPRHVFASVEELEGAVGRPLGCTDWLEIDQDTVDRFADVTRDHQWIHVDTERAASSPFGGTIAHGFLTLSLLPGLAQEVYSVEAGSARLNYGVEKVRFPAPVPVGAKVRASPTIAAVHRKPAGSQVVVRWTVEAEGVERPVCVAETLTLVVP